MRGARSSAVCLYLAVRPHEISRSQVPKSLHTQLFVCKWYEKKTNKNKSICTNENDGRFYQHLSLKWRQLLDNVCFPFSSSHPTLSASLLLVVKTTSDLTLTSQREEQYNLAVLSNLCALWGICGCPRLLQPDQEIPSCRRPLDFIPYSSHPAYAQNA